MSEKTRILGQGYRRVYGCPLCRGEDAEDCLCGGYCGSHLCDWSIVPVRLTVGPGGPSTLPREEGKSRGVDGIAQAPESRLNSGPEAPQPSGFPELSVERITDKQSIVQPHHSIREGPAQHTVAQTSSTDMLSMDGEHGSTVSFVPEPWREHRKGEVMDEFVKNMKGYPEFPPGVKLHPGVWDRKSPMPIQAGEVSFQSETGRSGLRVQSSSETLPRQTSKQKRGGRPGVKQLTPSPNSPHERYGSLY